MLAPFVPILASIITVALYFLRTTADPVVIYSGIASALVLWAVVAIPLMLYTSITRASATHFDALDVLIDQLDAKLGIAPGSGIVLDKEPPDESNSDPAAFKQALAVRNVIYKELRRRGLRWVTRKGYITLYSLLHEADPLLMQFEPVDQVAADTMHDRLRIAGSNIATGQQLLDNIAAGTRCLGPEAFLFFASKSDQQSAAGTIGDAAKLQAAARRMLGEVKSSVNTYRDNLWMSVATARNHLLITVLVVAFVTYLLVEFSAIGHVPPGDMLSAAILYLIGAIFGLLKRLSDESQTDHAVDDYGLTMARIVTSPVFSGLAAVAGVVLYFILLSYGTPAANLGSASPTISLSKVFDFANYPLDFVIAAIFGVAPNLIINYVQQQAKNYIGDIQSSEATHTTSSSK